MLRSDLSDFSDAYIVVNYCYLITVTEPENAKRNKILAFKNNTPLSTAFPTLMVCKLTTQKV